MNWIKEKTKKAWEWTKDKAKRFWKWFLGIFGVGVVALAATLVPSVPADGHIYVAQWEWVVEDRGPLGVDEYWRAPQHDNFKGSAIDLRSREDAGTKAIANGYGMFVYDKEVVLPDGVYLGTDWEGGLSAQQKAQIQSKLGIDVTQPRQIIDKVFEQKGINLQTAYVGKKEVYMEGTALGRKIWDLTFLTALAAIGTDELATDSFNRADSGSLGANWNVATGSYEILSNRAVSRTDAQSVGLWVGFDTDDANMEVGGVFRQLSGGGVSDGWLYCRYQDPDNNMELRISTFDQKINLRKNVNGTNTELDFFTGGYSQGIDYTLRYTCDGSSFEQFVDGTSRNTATDSDVAGPDEGIMRSSKGNSTGSSMDNFYVLGTTPATTTTTKTLNLGPGGTINLGPGGTINIE